MTQAQLEAHAKKQREEANKQEQLIVKAREKRDAAEQEMREASAAAKACSLAAIEAQRQARLVANFGDVAY